MKNKKFPPTFELQEQSADVNCCDSAAIDGRRRRRSTVFSKQKAKSDYRGIKKTFGKRNCVTSSLIDHKIYDLSTEDNTVSNIWF